MLELTNLEPDIVTYGVMAMGCINRQQAKEFFDKLAEKGVRSVSIFLSCSSLLCHTFNLWNFTKKITTNILFFH